MASRRLFIDRVFRLVTPSLDPDFTPGPAPLGEGLWSLDRRLRLFGAFVPCRSVLARLGTGDLVVIGAPALVSGSAAAIGELGRVAAVVAPNSFHYLYAGEVLAEFPSAGFVAAPGLPERVPALPRGLILDRPTASHWAPELEYRVFGPVRGVSEILFFHVSSRTLVCTDLASNLIRHERTVDRWITRGYGMRAEFGPSRNARTLLRVDPDESRRVLRAVLEWPFERIVVAHGESIESDARTKFTEAFAAFL